MSAICLPSSALAQGDTKYDLQSPTQVPAKVGDTPADYPGMPGGPVVVHEPAPAHEASGFDWTSAALGAAAGGLLVVVSLGGASAASHVLMRTIRS